MCVPYTENVTYQYNRFIFWAIFDNNAESMKAFFEDFFAKHENLQKTRIALTSSQFLTILERKFGYV